MQIIFRFDDKNWFTSDISRETVDNINSVIWILFHTLGAKEIRLLSGVEK